MVGASHVGVVVEEVGSPVEAERHALGGCSAGDTHSHKRQEHRRHIGQLAPIVRVCVCGE